MGCCMGKQAAGAAEQRGHNNLSKNKDNRANTWRATGIVSLRDGNIKVSQGDTAGFDTRASRMVTSASSLSRAGDTRGSARPGSRGEEP